MKKETRLDKLNALLGLKEKAVEVKTRATGKVVGITEDEIQEFRALQGLYYFLQAPELFTPKTCTHCKEKFLVSRKYVAFCSYTCIQKSLAEQGIQWRKGQDLETLALDPQVFDGNEPLWIRNLEKVKEIIENVSNTQTISDSTLVEKSPQDDGTTTPILSVPEKLPSLPVPTPTGVGKKPVRTSTTSRGKRRKITFNT